MIGRVWGMWQHGAFIAILSALGVLLVFMFLYVAALAVNALLGLLDAGITEDDLLDLLLDLWFVWGPIGVGYTAYFSSYDDLKSNLYPKRQSSSTGAE